MQCSLQRFQLGEPRDVIRNCEGQTMGGLAESWPSSGGILYLGMLYQS